MGHIDYNNFSYSQINIEIFQCSLRKLPDMLFKFFFWNTSQKINLRKKQLGKEVLWNLIFSPKTKK